MIFQVRDTESGDVTRQFPAESVVERYRRDPSARPFVLPEPSPAAEEQAGPPPPTIGGPVTEANREAENSASAPTGSDGADPAAATGASPTAGGTSEPPAGRTSIDLVA